MSPEKSWLEDDPFLLKWPLFRGHVGSRGLTRQLKCLQELKIESEEVWVPPTELDIDVPWLFSADFFLGNAW